VAYTSEARKALVLHYDLMNSRVFQFFLLFIYFLFAAIPTGTKPLDFINEIRLTKLSIFVEFCKPRRSVVYSLNTKYCVLLLLKTNDCEKK